MVTEAPYRLCGSSWWLGILRGAAGVTGCGKFIVPWGSTGEMSDQSRSSVCVCVCVCVFVCVCLCVYEHTLALAGASQGWGWRIVKE